MDIDDDDAFLYGDESPPKTEVVLPPVQEAPIRTENVIPATIPVQPIPQVTSNISSAMAASLAAYGLEPSITAVDNPEDGGVEEEDGEEDDEDDSDEDSDDDIKVVFTGQNARTLDLRKPQTAPSNVIGIGKWAHTSTGITPTPAPATPGTPQQISTPSKPIQPTANQTTEYTPTSRPGMAQPISGALSNPPISSTPTDSQVTLQPPSSSTPVVGNDGIPPINPGLPQSTLPPVSSTSFITSHNSNKGKFDPTQPNGIIPSTGQSVFELDMTQFENSGQPWRKPGQVLSDYFNFGFDEFTYPKYLKFKSDMEKGRAALANLPPMAQLPPDIANLLHLQNQQQHNLPFNPIAAQQHQQQIQQQQQQQQQMQIMANQIQQQMGMMNPQMQAQMQQMMAMQGLDMNMMNQGVPFNMQQNQGMIPPQQQGQGQIQGGMGQQGMMRPGQGQNVRPNMTPQPQSGNLGTPEAGEESVKQEEGTETGGETPELQQGQMINPAMRGRMPVRGVPVRGVPMRGRGVAVPLGPRAGFAAPTGPKAGRFRDKDKVDTSGAGSLDYGASEGGGDSDVNTTIKSDRVSSSSRQDQTHNAVEEGEEQDESNSRTHTQIGRSRSQSKSRDKSRSRSRSRSASPIPRKRRSSRREYESYSSDESDREREKGKSKDRGREREKERERDRDRDRKKSTRKTRSNDKDDSNTRSKRKRDEGSGGTGGGGGSTSATLGPGGWESEDEEDERRSRRKRSPSEVESEKRTRRSKRR